MKKMTLCINITCKEVIPAQGKSLIDYLEDIETDLPSSAIKKMKDKIIRSDLHSININPNTAKIDYVQYIENFLNLSSYKLIIFNIDNESRILPSSINEPVKDLAKINGWLRIFSSLPRKKRNESGILINDYLLSVDTAMKTLEKIKGTNKNK